MRYAVALLGLALLTACADDAPVAPRVGASGIRLVNGYTAPVDVYVDGVAAGSSIGSATIDTVTATRGTHTIRLQTTGGASTTIQVTVGASLNTLAAIRAGGTLASVTLDDTNSVVPAGATKVRVLHLAPSAGEITVMRTQPDYATPVQWQFPFTYSDNITSLGNPFYQSTPGTWDIRAWRKPSEDALGWAATTARATLTLGAGEKRTVVVLDRPGGGIRLEVIG